MKYSVVSIRPRFNTKYEWDVKFFDLPGDRVSAKTVPNALGYHYPRSAGKEKAFEIMKTFMVKQHEEEIARLTKRLAKLKALKI